MPAGGRPGRVASCEHPSLAASTEQIKQTGSGLGFKTESPPPKPHFLQQGCTSSSFPSSATYCGPGTPKLKTVGDISQSNSLKRKEIEA